LESMKRQRIYIDTSVIGGCFDDEFKAWSNGLFKDFKDGMFIPVISEITAAEIEKAPDHVKDKYIELLEYAAEIEEINDEVKELARAYVKRNILKDRYWEDALHIAIATINEVDVVVSWNFKHIVHYDKIRQFNGVNLEMGYKPVAIYSPMEVTSYGKKD